ncbi:hypothetical protein EZS27_008632 [termite gut metagenome]|uniref:DUF3078 domain-containing protein n=1 Tax=termite gut metagenome TaxID=433724 RepID=A0A5J4SCV8_9ZZZZ
MKYICTLLFFTIIFQMTLKAQENISEMERVALPTPLYRKYFDPLDSLYVLSAPVLKLDPDYYRLFVPLAYYHAPIKQISEMKWQFRLCNTLPDLTSKYLPFDRNKFNKTERINKVVNHVLIELYVNRPDLVVNTEERIMSRAYREEEIEISPRVSVIELFKSDVVEENVGTANIIIRKPNFWYRGGNGSFQMTQNYISKNWYKGGESNNSMIGNLQLFANYNDKEKWQIENLLEIKVGINTVSSQLDTMRIYRINSDMFRLSSKIGLQALSKWYYTVSGEFNTLLFPNYAANTNNLISTFMSPANVTISVGMDYKLKKERVNFSVVISPFSYNWRYVENDDVDETKFGLKKGKHSLNDLGSKLQSTLQWTIIPTITLNSRLYYFTDYEKVEAEWENTINFVLNRYLSTKLFVLYRYDDGIQRMKNYGYLQSNELLSFGLNYKW